MAVSIEDLQVGIRFYATSTDCIYEIMPTDEEGMVAYRKIDPATGLPSGVQHAADPSAFIRKLSIRLI